MHIYTFLPLDSVAAVNFLFSNRGIDRTRTTILHFFVDTYCKVTQRVGYALQYLEPLWYWPHTTPNKEIKKTSTHPTSHSLSSSHPRVCIYITNPFAVTRLTNDEFAWIRWLSTEPLCTRTFHFLFSSQLAVFRTFCCVIIGKWTFLMKRRKRFYHFAAEWISIHCG